MNSAYPLKQWFSTLIIGPLMILTYYAFGIPSEANVDVIEIYFLILAFGLFISLPVFLINVFVFRRMIKAGKSNLAIRTTLNIIALTGTSAIFYFINGSAAFALTICYSASVILSSILFKIKRETSELADTGNDKPTPL
jgi:hypothetical protein